MLALVSNSIAAVVSDNDGSAFITKAEFDSLKNNFQSQIDQYNTSIDAKIDSAIAQYLSGIKVETTKDAETAFALDGVNNKIVFIGGKTNKNNMSNMLSTKDDITEVFCGTYARVSYYIQDVYDTFAFEAHYEKDVSDRNNWAFVLDDEGRVSTSKKDVYMYGARSYVCFTTYHALNGIIWTAIKQELDLPTELNTSNSAYISTTEAQGIGLARKNTSETNPDIYTQPTNWKLYSANTAVDGFPGVTPYANYQNIWATPIESKPLTDIVKSTSVSITGEDVKPNFHWPQGSVYKIKSINKEWGSKDLIKKATTSLVDYTYVYKNRSVSGGHSAVNLTTSAGTFPQIFNAEVKGYGLEFAYDEKFIRDVYYNKTSRAWKEDLGYAGGVPICKTDKMGYVTITIQVDGEVEIAFQNEQNNNFPMPSDKRFKKFNMKVNGSSGDYQEKTASVVLTAGTYDFKVDLQANEKLFLTAAMGDIDGEVTFTQIGDAKVTSEQ